MNYADHLLLSSFAWRGIPDTFLLGLLGNVGDRFTTAFTEAPWNAVSEEKQYAFEYLTGLVFNGAYAHLQGLIDLVETWLETWAGGVRMVTDLMIPPHVYPHNTDLVETFNPPTRSAVYASPPVRVGVGEVRWLLYSPEYTGFPDRWFLYLRYSHPVGGPFFAYFWNDSGPNGSYLRGTRNLPEGRTPTVDVSLEDVPLSVFKPEILRAIQEYTVALKDAVRPPMPIEDTADAKTPNVFQSWAEGRYGPSVAY